MRKDIAKTATLLVAGVIMMTSPFIASTVLASEQTPEYELDNVVVTATKTQKSLRDVSSSVSVITREMIVQSTAKNVAELVTMLPGVALESRGGLGGINGISLRGLNGGPGSQKLLLLMDGRPANFSYDGSINWNTIPLDAVEKVEVIRGPGSALYGANALGGVINVIMKKPQGSSLTTSAKFGSFNTSAESMIYENGNDKTGIRVTAGQEETDGHRANGDYDGQNYTLLLTQKIGEDATWSLRSGYTKTDRGISGSKSSPGNYYRDRGEYVYGDLEYKQQSENLNNTIRIYQSDSKTESTKTASSVLSSKMEDSLLGVMLQQDFRVNPKQTVTWGADYQRHTADELLKAESYSADVAAIYVQNDQKLSDTVNLTLGARFDHHSVFGSQASPKLGLNYAPSQDVLWKINVAKSFKAPSLADLYSTSSSALGNRDLKPTEMWSYELGFEKQLDPESFISVVLYKSDAKNMIINERQSDGTRQKKNVGNIKPQGVEFEFKHKENANIDWFFNYTYLDVGDMTYLAARHKGNLGIAYYNQALKVSLAQQFVGKSYGKDYSQNPIDGYSVTNLKTTYSPGKSCTVELAVENLFDKQYEIYSGYPMPERNYTGTVTWKF